MWDVQELGIKAAQRILQATDPLFVLTELSQNFPTRTRSVSQSPLNTSIVDELTGNQQMLPGGRNLMVLNGVMMDLDSVDLYQLLSRVRAEVWGLGWWGLICVCVCLWVGGCILCLYMYVCIYFMVYVCVYILYGMKHVQQALVHSCCCLSYCVSVLIQIYHIAHTCRYITHIIHHKNTKYTHHTPTNTPPQVRLADALASTGLSSDDVASLMMLRSETSTNKDTSTAVALDDRTHIVWLNDLEHDAMYADWGNDVAGIFMRLMPGQLHRIGRNLYNGVLVVDPGCVDGMMALAVVNQVVSNRYPIRYVRRGLLWGVWGVGGGCCGDTLHVCTP